MCNKTIKQYIDHRKDLKIVLSSNDDKRLETPDKITPCPYGTDEMMMTSKSVNINDQFW